MDTSVVRWWDRSPLPPPRQRRRVIKVLRPRPNSSLWGVAINQDLITADTHWHDERAGKVRCREMWQEQCPWCPDPARRWYGYIPILFFATGQVAALEITWGAANDCPQLSTARIPLRGMRIEVGRRGKGRSGPCWAKVEPFHRTLVLPPPEPMEELLEMIFEPTEQGLPTRRQRREGGVA